MTSLKLYTMILAGMLAFTGVAHTKQHEVFDGQYYNGKYYPIIYFKTIDWTNNPRMEAQIHSKNDPVDMSLKIVKKKEGGYVGLLNYYLRGGSEKLCRKVAITNSYTDKTTIYTYIDRTDPDADFIWFINKPVKTGKKLEAYNMKPYSPCVDQPKSDPNNIGRSESANKQVHDPWKKLNLPQNTTRPFEPKPTPKKDGKGVGVDYENQAMPFSW